MLDDRTDIERGDAVAHAKHEIRVMLNQQNTDAAIAHDLNHRAQMFDFRVGQPARRFVEQDKTRPLRQCACDFKKALLGVLEQIRAPVNGMGEADAVQQLFGTGSQFALIGAHLRQQERACQKTGARITPATQHGVVEHREGRQQTRFLKGARYAEIGSLLNAGERNAGLIECDFSAVGPIIAGEQIEQRGLAAAIRTDQAVHLAGFQLQRDLRQGSQSAKAFGDAAGAQAHRACPLRMAFARRSRSGLTT